MRYLVFLVSIFCLMTACSNDPTSTSRPIKVEIVKSDDGYQLLRGGKPYEVRGAGMVIDDIGRIAAAGGNSIRIWDTAQEEQDTLALLDDAQAHGVTVALGLRMRHERHGFDYDDPTAVAAQLEFIRGEVLKYRDHPAVLMWIIGNELNHDYENPRVYDAVNDVAEMINELDSLHPTTTTTSGFKPDVNAEILARAPALDFVSFQVYGSLFGLHERLAETGFDRPFMVTEWGTIGYWEVETTDWGAPVELHSSAKADTFLRAYRDILEPLEGQLIGSYVFYWGQKQERTPTWFGILTEDRNLTEVADAMQYAWTGHWPENRAPRVEGMRLDGKTSSDSVVLQAGRDYEAVIDIVDPEGGPVAYRWELKPESTATSGGGDFEALIPNLEGFLSDTASATTTLTAPPPGKYRLFAYAADEEPRVAHANIPFLVEDEFRQAHGALLQGEVMAMSYSGFREGQHPDRGNGATNPSREEILEDLQILIENDFTLLRMYDSKENTVTTLELIREHGLPIKLLLGIWLDAEVSNHEGCPWLDEPIPDEKLAANTIANRVEIARAIELANAYEDIVLAINVGNEALVEWNDHMVPLEKVIGYVEQVKAAVAQPVTVADNYAWWAAEGKPLAEVVDFLGVHTYALWEDKTIDEALSFTIENIEQVHAALPGKPIAILEAGWATVANEFPERANEENQARYYREILDWATTANVTVFFFEAFDEPWKGDPANANGAEKHWGIFNVDRTPKLVMR
jgi:exo-beta-1,3-glucanase (GH17 family)